MIGRNGYYVRFRFQVHFQMSVFKTNSISLRFKCNFLVHMYTTYVFCNFREEWIDIMWLISCLNDDVCLNCLCCMDTNKLFIYTRTYYRKLYSTRSLLIFSISISNSPLSILCDEEMDIHKQIAACQNLFGLFLYRFNWNAHLNIRAFATLQGREQRACTVQTIQWKVIGGPTNWSPMLLTCYGQHKPIRTSRELDDYYETFFLTSGSSPTQMYLFKRITTAKTREIVLLGKHSAKQDPRLTEGVTISPVEVKRDGYLSTVETRNFDLAEIEMIYALDVIDVISQPDAFEWVRICSRYII